MCAASPVSGLKLATDAAPGPKGRSHRLVVESAPPAVPNIG